MYEGPIKAVGSVEPVDAPMLRQLRWTDLVARLAATRGQRTAPAVEAVPDQPASFAGFQHGTLSQGDRRINRDALSNGKFARLSASDTAPVGAGPDRETP